MSWQRDWYVIVNGQIVIDDGQHNAMLASRVLKRGVHVLTNRQVRPDILAAYAAN